MKVKLQTEFPENIPATKYYWNYKELLQVNDENNIP